jgi:nitrile hydratase
MVVCTLCSCYPWPVLGLPPVWYKSAPYRSRAVIDPRGVLADFGVSLPARHRGPGLGLDRRTALPGRAACVRPAPRAFPKQHWPTLVTRDSMIGTGLALPQSPSRPEPNA